MSKSGSIIYIIEKQYLSMLKAGESRHLHKNKHTAKQYIFSYGTFRTYMREMGHFVSWARSNNLKIKDLNDIKNNSIAWLMYSKDIEKLSPYTLQLRRSALTKLLQIDSSYYDCVQIPKKKRAEITKNRNPKTRKDYHKSENLDTFVRCTGCRLDELKHIQGSCLEYNNEGLPLLSISKGTKGGRPRKSIIIGNEEELSLITQLCNAAGNEVIFKHIPSSYHCHHLRAEYAERVYNYYSRPVETIKNRREILYCRKDRKGLKLDKKALQITSNQLGHNRISVCSDSYLYNIDNS